MTPAVRITRLPSGVRVATEVVPGARSVSVGVWVGVGARDEPAHLAGVSHFLEHLLFKGTATRSARDIAEAIDRVGGDMNAFTAKEYTAYYCRLPAGLLGLGLDVLGDVLTAPALRAEDVESERQVILEELAMDDDSPEDRVHALAYAALFPGHPLGRETAGEKATVASITAEEVRRFFAEHYRPAHLVVAAAGAVDHDEVVAAAAGWFPAGADGAPLVRRPPRRRVRPLAVLRRRTEQAHLVVAFPALARDDPDREALDVVNHVLGGGLSSRLFEEIREKRGLAYSVYSAPAAYADAGTLTVYAGTSPTLAGQVLDLIDVELARMVAHGCSDHELAVAKGALTGSYLLSLEDPASRMARLGGLLVTLGHVRSVEEQVERWQRVDHAAVRRVIDRVLGGPRVTAAVGPLPRRWVTERLAA